MDLAAEVHARSSRHGYACAMTTVIGPLAETDPELAEQARRIIFDRSLSERVVADVLRSHGVAFPRQSIGHHRRGDCLTCRTS